MQDLNVSDHPTENPEDFREWDEMPRTDILYAQRIVLDMDKYVTWSAYNQRMISIPPVFSQRYKMIKAVRFVKSCESWESFRDMDGQHSHYQCTAEAQYRVIDWSDNPNEPTVFIVCNSHADDILRGPYSEWYEVQYLVDSQTVSV